MTLNYSEEFLPSSANMYQILRSCMQTTGGLVNLSLIIAANVFVILPLAALVLYLSVQRWLQSSHPAAGRSDHFTYYMICNVVLNFFGVLLVRCGVSADLTGVVYMGLFIFGSNLFAHMFFDTLTCAERYLAVVHPVTYRNLKNAKGLFIIYSAIGGCWLLSIAVAGVIFVTDIPSMSFIVLGFTSMSLFVVFFCSLSVICVLIRPGPGEVRVKRVDQSKLRAFYTILIILLVMLIRMMVTLFIDFLYTLLELDQMKMCDLLQPLFWCGLPSCLMPFVLFLQRERKICCKNNKV